MQSQKTTPPVVSGALPIIGHALEFSRDRASLFRRGYSEHGAVFAVKLGPQHCAVLIGPENHAIFFNQTDKALNMAKPYRFLHAMFGDVLFVASHDAYKEQRPVVLEAFKRHKMTRYVEIMQEEVQRWLDSLGDTGEMELNAELNRLVQAVAGHALMGRDFQERVGREFWDLYNVLSQALDPMLPPHWPLPKFRRRDQAKARMRAMLSPIIAERRRNPEAYDDFLQDFVNKRYKDGREVEEEVLIGLMLGLMFAGHETTAGQAAWTVIQLLQNPEYLALVQAEIDDKLPPGTQFELKAMADMHHINWAIRETERTRPSADILLRYVDQDITAGDYLIPAGWLTQIASEVAHRLPELFAEPDRFDPLRYAPGREEDKQHRFALIGFGGGMHKCPGMNFANNEQLIITALLFQQFEVELLTPDPGIDRGLGANRPTKAYLRYKRKPL